MCRPNSQSLLSVFCAAALAGAIATASPGMLSLDLDRAIHGEWWRFLSGHFAHLSWRHYLMDQVALGMAIWLWMMVHERLRTLLAFSLISAASVSFLLVMFKPVGVYGGLSGVTVGLMVFAAMKMYARMSKKTGAAILLAVLFKIVMEFYGFSLSAVQPVWQAHCAGALAGIFFFWWRATAKQALVRRRLLLIHHA